MPYDPSTDPLNQIRLLSMNELREVMDQLKEIDAQGYASMCWCIAAVLKKKKKSTLPSRRDV